jgi:plastocyanin
MKNIPAIFGFLLVAMLLLGCTQPKPIDNGPAPQPSPGSNSGNVKEFNVLIMHTGYQPNSFTVNKGDSVRFVANTAPGTTWHGHGIAIDEFSVNQAVKSEDASNPVIIQFVADKSGTFRIYCKTCNADADSFKATTGAEHPPIEATLMVK